MDPVYYAAFEWTESDPFAPAAPPLSTEGERRREGGAGPTRRAVLAATIATATWLAVSLQWGRAVPASSIHVPPASTAHPTPHGLPTAVTARQPALVPTPAKVTPASSPTPHPSPAAFSPGPTPRVILLAPRATPSSTPSH